MKWQHEEAAISSSVQEKSASSPLSPRDTELLAEARLLRHHKSRLETRMQILEDHNKQLESQLRRLRELLLQVSDYINDISPKLTKLTFFIIGNK